MVIFVVYFTQKFEGKVFVDEFSVYHVRTLWPCRGLILIRWLEVTIHISNDIWISVESEILPSVRESSNRFDPFEILKLRSRFIFKVI